MLLFSVTYKQDLTPNMRDICHKSRDKLAKGKLSPVPEPAVSQSVGSRTKIAPRSKSWRVKCIGQEKSDSKWTASQR